MFEISFDSNEPMEMQFSNVIAGAVSSVNGQTGDVVLDAGDIAYSDSETYSSGSVGAEVSDLKSDLGDLSDLETTDKSSIVAAINEAAQSGGGGAAEVFWAIYGTTTSAQIEAAAADGKVVMCVYSGRIYRLQEIDSTNHYAYFCCWEDGASKFDLICDNDTWDASTSTIGTYSKPSGGIPKTDLASAVQTSLNKADSAIPAPSSASAGQFLVYNGTDWVAQTLSTWQGGSY